MEDKKKLTKIKIVYAAIIGALILVLVALLGYVFYQSYAKTKDARMMMKEFHEYQEKEGISIVYYASSECHFCEFQTPILEEIAKEYDLEYLKIDYTKLSKKQNKEILDYLDIKQATPTTVVLKDGKPIAVQKGYVEGYKLVDFFIKAGVLAEDATYQPEQYLTFIDYDEFEDLKKSKDPVAIVLGTSTCQYCASAKPILSNISNAYHIPIYYYSFNYSAKEDRTAFFKELKEMGYDEEGFLEEGTIITPTIIVVKDKKIVSYLNSLQNVTLYVKYFKEQNIIK